MSRLLKWLLRTGWPSRIRLVVASSENAYPFALENGWPAALPGNVVTIRETGVVLGSLLLEDEEWRALQSSVVLSLRIDDHPVTDGWTCRQPDGSESSVEFEVPLTAVVVPPEALMHGRAFSEWAMDTHGARGRLLIWDDSLRWWMAHEPDLELAVTCAPIGMFADASDEPSWLPFLTPNGRREVEELRARYGVTWDEGTVR